MTEMIAAEPALAERIARRLAADPALDRLAGALRGARDAREPMVVFGCGTSEHAAEGMAAMLRVAGLVAAQHAQALDIAAAPPRAGVAIAVSHEGGTAATNAGLVAAREAGVATALVTVGIGSPGARAADLVVATGEQDASWCHTVGYVSPLVVGAVLAAAVRGDVLDGTAARALLAAADVADGAQGVATGLAAAVDRLIVVGGGADHASARELALKVEEGARVPARALHLETVLHGHLAAAGPRTGLILILTEAAATEAIVARAGDVLRAVAELGMPAAAILGAGVRDGVPRDLTPAGRVIAPASSRLPTVVSGLLGAAIPLQLVAERLARARGVNPDTLGREDSRQAAAHR